MVIDPESHAAGGNKSEFISVVVLRLQRAAPARDEISLAEEGGWHARARIKIYDRIGACDVGRCGERGVTVCVRPVLPEKTAADADRSSIHECRRSNAAVDGSGFYGDGLNVRRFCHGKRPCVTNGMDRRLDAIQRVINRRARFGIRQRDGGGIDEVAAGGRNGRRGPLCRLPG